ncbi:MAG: alpha/beta hydrolase [Phycisphaerae bacterium]|nr:alpha/beta hydrolase [Phycisphaerae bacterium]
MLASRPLSRRLCLVSWIVLAGSTCLVARPLTTSAPAPPKGYASTEEVKAAIGRGEVRLINLLALTPANVVVKPDVEYGRVGDISLKLDLYQPRKLERNVPAILLIHGGAWKSGHRSVYRPYCIKLAERGYVAATVSYRLSGQAPYPAAVHDVKCAVRWLRANANVLHVDPDRIAAMGGSAGGHLAMMLGYSPKVAELEGDGENSRASSRVQAVINFYGPTDLTTPFARSQPVVVSFMGGRQYQEAQAMYRQASPLTHLTRDAPPTLILHGTIDDTVPIEQADALATRLKELDVPCEYVRLAGWPHTMDLAQSVSDYCWYKIDQFLARHLPLPAGATAPAEETGRPGESNTTAPESRAAEP